MIHRLLTRLASWLLITMGRKKWGLSAAVMPTIVNRLGPIGALRWAARNLPEYERALAYMGPVRGNLAFTFASMLNGCAYCAYAHSRAFQLHFFKHRGRVFPLDEHQMIALTALPDDEIRTRLEKALHDAGMSEDEALFRRIQDLKYHGVPAGSQEDKYLLHAIQMYDVLNLCAIGSQVPLDDAHDPINYDIELKARYAEARLGLLDGVAGHLPSVTAK